MKHKNRAVKTVNIALGLILLVMVILCSPLFGYARGFSPEDQRGAAPVSADTTRTSPSWSVPVEATPRPTAPPTPTPVVLPTAPPTPEPTPVPQRTPQPQPVVQQPAVQQPVYNNWQPEQQYQPEPDYVEPGYENVQPEEEQQSADEQQQFDGVGQITDTGNGGVIQGSDGDLVINLPYGGGQSTAVSVAISEVGETGGGDLGGETGGGGGEVVWQPSQDSNEAEPLAF